MAPLESITRPRVAIALLSALTAVSVFYYLYTQLSLEVPADALLLRRSNAIRRRRGRARLRSLPPSSSSSSSEHSPGDENADVGFPPPIPSDEETVMDGPTTGDEWWADPSGIPAFRAGQNIVSLLFRVSEDNARKNASVHRGCRCNSCGTVPIRGLRYHCANCADFDLCETCESQGVHIKTHIFYKIRIPAKMASTRYMQPVWYTGDPENTRRPLTKALISRLSRDTGLERPELEAHWEQWTFMANTEWRDDPDELCLAMDRKTFERSLISSRALNSPSPNLVLDRIFAFYDTNNDGLIGFAEYLHGISYPHRRDKLRSVFNVYDLDGDGYVSRRDFLRLFRASYVLYKDMFRDLLDGMNDQRLGSAEAKKLINSRQPLSGLFGRDERPHLPDREARLEGKRIDADGNVELRAPFPSVVRPDGAETASREEILSRIASHPAQFPDSYIRALLRSPNSVVQIPNVLSGRPIDEIDQEHRRFIDTFFEGLWSGYARGNHDESAIAEDETADPRGPGEGPDEDDELADLDAGRPLGPERGPPSVEEHELRQHRQKLERTMLYERWKKRQFFLDEEEGASAPEGWSLDDDILVAPAAHGENTVKPAPTHTHPFSPRSRSSSKVRFVEDTDDPENWSNHSASSRSVPERWGGFDIPGAERDAGKEILYQVTQQACNELLDGLFKEKEDLAVQASTMRDTRRRYQHLIDAIDLEEGARDGTADAVVSAADHGINGDIGARGAGATGATGGGEEEGHSGDVDGDESFEMEVFDCVEEALLAPFHPSVSSDYVRHNEGNSDAEYTSAEDEPTGRLRDASRPKERGFTAARRGNGPGNVPVYRDPTMPQFRPNSAADGTPPPAALNEEAVVGIAGKEIWHGMLVEWKRLDVAEAEAAARGGWGRLSYDEFETLWKRQEIHNNKLDYLSGWIEFCIL